MSDANNPTSQPAAQGDTPATAGGQVAPAPATAAPGVSVLAAAAISAAVTVCLVASALMLYDHYRWKPQRAIATLDIEALVSAREVSIMSSLTRPETTDADRAVAYDKLSGFGKQLEDAIGQAAAECNCDILVRGAVVGRAARDLTDDVGARLGINALAVAEGRDRIRRSLADAKPPSPQDAKPAEDLARLRLAGPRVAPATAAAPATPEPRN